MEKQWQTAKLQYKVPLKLLMQSENKTTDITNDPPFEPFPFDFGSMCSLSANK